MQHLAISNFEHCLFRTLLSKVTLKRSRLILMQTKLSLMPVYFSSIFIIPLLFPWTVSCSFTITNNCPFTIWPGTLSGSASPPLSTTGFQLDSGKSVRIEAVPGWSGRIWARTGCKFDETGAGKCQTGDCGGRLECDGNGATPPASLFEITFGQGDGDKDFYDVSLVDGYNLPLVASPIGASGACNSTGCVSDLNMGCPKELQVVGGDEQGGVVACKSACDAFGQDKYCCSGQFANPTTCQPSYYSAVFKKACPRAYSYAYDDGTSTFTCKAYSYDIVFCPSTGAGRKKPNSDTYSSTTPASFLYNNKSPTQNEKHSYRAAAGETSSSYAVLPYSAFVPQILFSLLLLR